ncbi:MAG: UDP-2,3-diacylglucosamine diphosphatase [Fibrobacterota bacterium]
MSKVFFISDAHLGADIPEAAGREEVLCRFLEKVRLEKASDLYMLGDIFDFWFEYKTVVPSGHQAVLCGLRRLIEDGVRVHYVAGNHDFWMGDFLTRDIGIELYFEPLQTEIGGMTFYLHHGDGIAASDRMYRFLKKVLRNPLNIFLYRLIHPDLGIPLAKRCSGSSRKYAERREFPPEFLKDYHDYAKKKINENCDFVIMGHTHLPEKISIDSGTYMNTGSWIKDYYYVIFEDNKASLKNFRDEM